MSLAAVNGCNGTGTVTASVLGGGTPPYMYSWSYLGTNTVSTTNVLSNYIGGGVYLFVTDAVGDTNAATAYVPPHFQVSVTTTDAVCPNSNGTATAAPQGGGTPPFTYLWSNGATTPTATGLMPAIYACTVTDANGCAAGSYGWVSQLPSITAPQLSVTSSFCMDGTATVNPSGGTPPYSYIWNTIPAQTTQTATNLHSGFVRVTVTDAIGCSNSFSGSVPLAAGSFTLSISSTPENCTLMNGTATVSATGGTPPYTYAWANGATTASISGLSAGYYRCTVTDAASCQRPVRVQVLRANPVSVSASAVPPSNCQTNGSITITPSGGTPPYTYQNAGGATTPTATGLGFGRHWYHATDANGCHDYGYLDFQAPPQCLNIINGVAYDDANGNCMLDLGEHGHRDQVISVGPNQYVFTGPAGAYSISTLQTGTIAVSQSNLPYYHVQSCPSGAQSVTFTGLGMAATGVDFGNTVTSTVQDYEVHVSNGPARPGFLQNVWIHARNIGAQTLPLNLTFNHDPSFSYAGSTSFWPSPTIGSGSVTWQGVSLDHGESLALRVDLAVPTTALLGQLYSSTASLTPVGPDMTPQNNSHTANGVVVGSYDPNEKVVDKPSALSVDDTTLTYTVFFQNTGTDTAFTVVVRDTLDPDLDLRSLDFIGASHAYSLALEAGNVLVVTFDHIMLPDSHINEPRSHGQFMYRMRIKPSLSAPIYIDNRAAIYFDYNLPIITNTVHNELVIESAADADPSQFELWPNPSDGMLKLRVHAGEGGGGGVLRVHDLAGRTLHMSAMQAGASEITLDLSGLPSGLYLLELERGGKRCVRRFVKE